MNTIDDILDSCVHKTKGLVSRGGFLKIRGENMKRFEINGKQIGQGCEPFIIAEAGINHNGDIDLAKKIPAELSAGIIATERASPCAFAVKSGNQRRMV